MAKTFLELVNTAMDECKVTLDPLTSANFASPPRTDMYNRFKRWVNDALEELLTTRNEWFSRIERANVYVYPRIHLSNILVPPMVDYVYRGKTSGVSFVVQAVHSFEFVEPSLEISEATVSVLFQNDADVMDLVPNEAFDVTSPAPTFNAAVFKGNGFYDFEQLVPTLERVDDTSFILYDPPEEYAGDGQVNEWRVIPVNWHDTTMYLRNTSVDVSYQQRTVAQTPQGNYVFNAPIDRKYLLAFDYTRKITKLVNWDDVPVDIPDKYQPYLIWRAARSFADFQGDPKLFSRTTKEENKFMNWMERDESPKVTIGSSRFYVR